MISICFVYFQSADVFTACWKYKPKHHLKPQFSWLLLFCWNIIPVLQTRRSSRANLGIITTFLHKDLVCDPLLKLSRRGGSNEGVKTCFRWEIRKNLCIILTIPSYLVLWLHIISSDISKKKCHVCAQFPFEINRPCQYTWYNLGLFFCSERSIPSADLAFWKDWARSV